MTKGWIRPWKVARLLDCSKDHVYDLVYCGKLKGIKLGSRGMRVSQESLDQFLEESRVVPQEINPEKN